MGNDSIPQLLGLAVWPGAYFRDLNPHNPEQLIGHNNTLDFTTMNQEQTRLDPALLNPVLDSIWFPPQIHRSLGYREPGSIHKPSPLSHFPISNPLT